MLETLAMAPLANADAPQASMRMSPCPASPVLSCWVAMAYQDLFAAAWSCFGQPSIPCHASSLDTVAPAQTQAVARHIGTSINHIELFVLDSFNLGATNGSCAQLWHLDSTLVPCYRGEVATSNSPWLLSYL
jgi:hypothetical protein